MSKTEENHGLYGGIVSKAERTMTAKTTSRNGGKGVEPAAKAATEGSQDINSGIGGAGAGIGAGAGGARGKRGREPGAATGIGAKDASREARSGCQGDGRAKRVSFGGKHDGDGGKKQRLAPTVEQAIAKIVKAMGSKTKFSKAAALMEKLVASQLQASNSSTFYDALCSITSDRERLRAEHARAGFISLFDAVEKQRHHFHAIHQPKLDLWQLDIVAHNKLFTDDTYQFAKVAKRLNEAIAELPDGDDAASVAIRQAVVDALGTMLSMYTLAWAKPAIHTAFMEATQRRLRFDEAQRTQLDAWATQLQSMRTQLRKQDQLRASKVGGSNVHPLFNLRR